MTTDDLARQIAQLANDMTRQFARMSDDMARQFAEVDVRMSSLEDRMETGFDASKIRDEEILRVAKLGLEANEILQEEMNRRFDASDMKTDQQIGLLKAVIRTNVR